MTQTGYDVMQAAGAYWDERGYANWKNSTTTHKQDAEAAFSAGVAWQKERDNLMPNEPVSDLAELRIAIGTLSEGMAEMLKRQGELAASAVRGAERGQRAIDAIKDVGEKVEAVQSQLVDIELIAARVEGYVEAPDVVNVMESTEPMHAEVKAAPSGDTWPMHAKVVPIEECSDEMLNDLYHSGQIETGRYIKEFNRRHPILRDVAEVERSVMESGFKATNDKITMGVDLASPGSDHSAGVLMRDGQVIAMGTSAEGFAVAMAGDRVIVLYGGRLYDLRGMDLIPLRFGA